MSWNPYNEADYSATLDDLFPERVEARERVAKEEAGRIREQFRRTIKDQQRMVQPEHVLLRVSVGEPIDDLIGKALGRRQLEGQLWYVHTTFRSNVLGTVRVGSLLEISGEPDATLKECCDLIDGESPPGGEFKIKRLTAR